MTFATVTPCRLAVCQPIKPICPSPLGLAAKPQLTKTAWRLLLCEGDTHQDRVIQAHYQV